MTAGGGAKFTGVNPGESGDGGGRKGGAANPFDEKTYDEKAQIRMFRDSPEAARALAKQAGISIL